MRKAFLCHSSKDKDYVRFVARRLRRANVVYDEFSFEAGEDFRKTIEKGLDQSALFVFFASQESLASIYCRFEVDQAQLKQMHGGIEGQLALIIDPAVPFADLPKWMRNAKALVQTKPTQAVRDIEQALFRINPELRQRPLLGRQRELEDFAHAVATEGPRLFVTIGLDGVGRRSFVERACADNLGLKLGPYFLIDETRDLEDLYLELYEETADITSRSTLADEMKAFAKLDRSARIAEIASRLHLLCADKNVPCLVDRGGMLAETGEYLADFKEVIDAFVSTADDHYLASIHRRRVRASRDAASAWFLQSLAPLSLGDTKLLLSQLFRNTQVPLSRDSVEQLALMAGGYPPAAYFIESYARVYGVDTLIADRSILGDFKARNFSRLLTDLKLPESHWTVLRYLASEVSVPLSAIAIAVGLEAQAAATITKELIDQSLVVAFGDSYALSPPIQESVERARGYLSAVDYTRIADGLTRVFWSDENVAPSLHVVDATLHAVARSINPSLEKYRDLIRPSTVHRLATECYHRKQWSLALEYSRRVQQMAPLRRDAWSLEFKSLIQLEQWDEAETVLKNIERNHDKIAFYLKGFGLRRHQRHRDACKAFEQALRSGDKANSVYRDYADSLYRLGEYDKAAEMVKVVLDRDPENVFVLDLLARVYLDWGNLDDAAEVVKQLDRYDIARRFLHHRRAALYSKQELWDLAIVDADEACSERHSPFEAFAQRANILIELDRLDDAREAILVLERRFSTHGRDVRKGLTCKTLIREGHWREARTVWDQLEAKNRPVHRHLLLQILRLQANDATTSLVDRESARRSVEGLEHELSGTRLVDPLDLRD